MNAETKQKNKKLGKEFKKVHVVNREGKRIYKNLRQYPDSNILDWGDNYGFVDAYELKRLGWEIREGWD